MAEKMILEVPVHPERREEFLKMLPGVLPETRAYDGNISVEVWTPEGDESSVWLYEEWENREKQAAYFNWRMETGLIDKLAPFLKGEPKVIWLASH